MIKHEEKLQDVEPKLVACVVRAAEILPFDLLVVEGVRTHERMCENWGKGRTADECTSHGVPAAYARPHEPKVTWLANPFHSRHAAGVDGLGSAVDIAPVFDGKVNWNDLHYYDKMASAMFQAAMEQGVKLRWGADWNENGKPRERGESDNPHFELEKQDGN